MAENKTKKTSASVAAFLNQIEDPDRRRDAKAVSSLMKSITGDKPKMWGAAIVGFGTYHYTYASGRSGEFFRVGFAPRKANLVLYIMDGFSARAKLLKQLGPHKTGKACLYIKRLSDIDEGVLRALIEASLAHLAEQYHDQ